MTQSKVEESDRFAFGKNWQRYLVHAEEREFEIARNCLKELLGQDDMSGLTFLDIGSGSGIHSLAAANLGACVTSFDYDSDSVAATRKVKAAAGVSDARWRVMQGSILDGPFVESLGRFDVVYSWGVLHHTGAMWEAVERSCCLVAEGGSLVIALYRDCGLRTRAWWWVKRLYITGRVGRWLVLGAFVPAFWLGVVGNRLIRFQNPRRAFVEYRKQRGMSMFHDWIDWLGGYPYETASVGEVVSRLEARSFRAVKTVEAAGVGCSEFVFTRVATLESTIERENRA
ncbi:MAG: class I SAM-dependent methyltransferase [Planctomycetota bacterium]